MVVFVVGGWGRRVMWLRDLVVEVDNVIGAVWGLCGWLMGLWSWQCDVGLFLVVGVVK